MAHNTEKISILDLQRKKESGNPITMLTAYDYTAARLVDGADVDIILVGDSLAMVMLGRDGTVGATMEEMLHHARAVANGTRRAFLIGDLPFLSYQTSTSQAIYNAGLFLKEAGMDAVKLEGGEYFAPTVRAIVAAGIPVMGHIGLTPQTTSQLGGYRVQGRTAVAAQQILNDAQALEAAGCFALVLEAVPREVGKMITERLSIPTIGIGAGPDCDGQVLVFHDLLGMYDDLKPRFVKEFAQVGRIIQDALQAFQKEVTAKQFPAADHCYHMKEEEFVALQNALAAAEAK